LRVVMAASLWGIGMDGWWTALASGVTGRRSSLDVGSLG
jgi:hypothetical protein